MTKEQFRKNLRACRRRRGASDGGSRAIGQHVLSRSDKKRKTVRAGYAKRRRQHRKEERAEEKRIEKLRTSARAKLTPEEAEACGLD